MTIPEDKTLEVSTIRELQTRRAQGLAGAAKWWFGSVALGAFLLLVTIPALVWNPYVGLIPFAAFILVTTVGSSRATRCARDAKEAHLEIEMLGASRQSKGDALSEGRPAQAP